MHQMLATSFYLSALPLLVRFSFLTDLAVILQEWQGVLEMTSSITSSDLSLFKK